MDAGIRTRTTGTQSFEIKSRAVAAAFFFLLAAVLTASPCLGQQDWIKTGTGLGVDKVRLAVPDFKPSTSDTKNADLLKVFNDTLWNDLDNAGIFEMVSKSFYPLAVPGTPTDVQLGTWNAPPPNAVMLAFGNLGVTGNNVTVQGWLYDVKNATSPQVSGQTVSGHGDDRCGADDRAQIRRRNYLSAGRRHSRDCGEPDFLCEQPQRTQGNLGDGLRWGEPAADHASGLDFALSANFSGWFASGFQFDDEIGLGHPDVFDGTQSSAYIPQVWRYEPLAGVVGRWYEAGIFFFALRGF